MNPILPENTVLHWTDIKRFVQSFLLHTTDLPSAQSQLKTIRNNTFLHFSLKDSRAIWFALLLYKFNHAIDAPQTLWNHARNLILYILRTPVATDDGLVDIMSNYLTAFNAWKSDDLALFVADVASSYFNLLQIKQHIESTQNETTIQEWSPHYSNLLLHIRSNCQKIGCLDQLDSFVHTMTLRKIDVVSQIVQNVFWDSLRNDLIVNDYSSLLRNLNELKIILVDIHPKSLPLDPEIDNVLDLRYIEQRIQNAAIDAEFIIQIYQFTLKYLQHWDSAEFQPKYAEKLSKINELPATDLPELITETLRIAFLFAIDLKTRIDIIKNSLINRD